MANPHALEGSRIPHLNNSPGLGPTAQVIPYLRLLLPQERLRFHTTCYIKQLFLSISNFLFRYAAQFIDRARKQSIGFYVYQLIVVDWLGLGSYGELDIFGEKDLQKLHYFWVRTFDFGLCIRLLDHPAQSGQGWCDGNGRLT